MKIFGNELEAKTSLEVGSRSNETLFQGFFVEIRLRRVSHFPLNPTFVVRVKWAKILLPTFGF